MSIQPMNHPPASPEGGVVAPSSAELAESEAKFRLLADTMPQIIWITRPDGYHEYYNQHWWDYTGLTWDQARGDGWNLLLHPDDLERSIVRWQEALRTGEPYDIEYRFRRASDGVYRWFLGRALPQRDPATGEIVKWFGTCTDIDDQKRAEARLRGLTRRLEFLNDLSEATREVVDPEIVMAIVCRQLGEQLQVSRCAYADVELDSEHFTIRHDYTAGGCATTVGSYRLSLFGARAVADQRAGRTLVVRDVERELPQDGDGGAASFNAIGIKAIICCPLVKENRLVAMMAVHHAEPRDWAVEEIELVEATVERSWADIERARANRAVAESESRFRSLVTETTLIVWQADNQGAIFGEVPGWETFTGQTREEYVGRGWFRAVHPEDRERTAVALRQATEKRQKISHVFRLRRRDGEYRRVDCVGIPLPGPHGEVREWIGTCTDVEDKLRLDEQRDALLAAERSARSEAERNGRLKDEFLANLSHELRTPLNAILGWAQMLRGEGLSAEEIADGLTVIERNARVQTQLIEDLLDVSRIISGKVRLDVQRLELASVIEAAINSVKPTAETKGVRLQAVLDPLDGPVMGDPARIQQIVWNLLSNAIKFTPRNGRVQVFLARVNSHVEITVSDTGLGIRADFLPHVFERFRQEDGSITRRHGGLGLGLAIVKNLAEMHGGTVRAQSPGEGQGATFIVHLPLAIVHPGTGDSLESRRQHPRASFEGMAECPPELKGARVLVVDDEPDGREIVRRMLERCDAVVATASSAEEGRRLVQEFRPDVLVSDIGMPGEDGYQFLRSIRDSEAGYGRKVPALALTAFARSEDRRRALLAGFDMHVAKPVDAAELVTVVARLADKI